MAPFLEVVLVAFGYQLLVLPGEKVQIIIAGLATRFHPLVVVAAAGSAFAGWTALEILFGELLTRVLPQVVLDSITAGLFLLFAALLVKSAPEPDASAEATDGGLAAEADLDGSILGYEITTRHGAFLPIFAMMAAGEFGDKTQLVTIGLAAQYGAHPGIWLGEMLAIIPVSLANAYVFHHLVGHVDIRKAHLVGAAVFLFFGLDTVLGLLTGVSVWEVVVTHLGDVLTGALG